MNRDTIIYCSCTFLLGLVIGALVIGPHMAKASGAPATVAGAAMPAADEGAAPAAGAPAQNPMGEIRQQLATLKDAVARNPRDVDSLGQLGNMYMDAAKFPEAIRYYEQALAVREDPNLRVDLGICYKQNGQPDKALVAFRQAEEESPGQWQPLYNEAVVLGEMKRFDEARAIAAKLQVLRPGDAEVQRLTDALAKAR